MPWVTVADTSLDGTSQIVVTVANGKVEIFDQKDDERLGALVFQSVNKETSSSDNNLEIGFWDDDGEWVAQALFQGKTYLYVRTR
jgi:hypothetical protein